MKQLQNIAIVLTCMTVACNNSTNTNTPAETAKYTELRQANWLIGKWEHKSGEENSIEIWEKENDSTFSGFSYTVVGKDTVSSEKIKLAQVNNDLFYIPTVSNQNGGQPVSFKLKSGSYTQMTFENPEHDFPQKITYTKIADDSLLAVISGLVEGRERSQEFPMSRSKP